MTALDALTTITLLAIVPALVWWLGRTGWTGDRKRVVVIAVALLLGVLQAILTGVIAVTPGILAILERAVITVAGVLVLSQSVYTLLWSKLPDSDAEPESTLEPIDDVIARYAVSTDRPTAELVPTAEHATPEAVAALTAWHDQHGRE